METNNKLREALSEIVSDAKFAEKELEGEFGSMTDPWSYVTSMADIARSALSTPPRNCDVGTAEEQVARYHAFCAKMMKQNNHCCGPCPCHEFINGEAQSCTLLWAQMPYEEGGEK